ncbi:DNA topoisomerase IV subunit B [Fulvimarina pelagi HTCC2506]|uniref:DNA topoisomerase IV subunit B n=1 Tax=Fulvimarina pelagi HTCC2506 TaxID=314231 RepID=Q0G795_9HYPH|nr:hypothetical protein [Fulvimarina pelagi]EAU42469.1 DNA topoisomerase IV subunit B [Fulvimarina pelagi HTCC2506]
MRHLSAKLCLASSLMICAVPVLAQGNETPAENVAPDQVSPAQTPEATAPSDATIPSDEPAAAPEAAEDAAPAAAQSQTIGSDSVAQVVGTLSPLVEDVQVVGPWREGDRNGIWRAVMARDPADPAKSQFFIQQIAPSPTGAQITRSIKVDEVAALGGAVVGYTADEPAEGQEGSLTLFFEIVPLDGEIAETYELRVQPDGSYDFGFATN